MLRAIPRQEMGRCVPRLKIGQPLRNCTRIFGDKLLGISVGIFLQLYKGFTPRTDDLYDLFPLHDLDLSRKIYS